MGILYRLNKAEYFFNPLQLLKRISGNNLGSDSLRMPWGRELYFQPHEAIGNALNTLGYYELPLCEIIYRCQKEATTFLDIGANVGYFSSLALASKNIKNIHSFEPHPKIYEYLEKNTSDDSRCRQFSYALSEEEGEAELFLPKDFDTNAGLATLEKDESSKDLVSIKVRTLSLLDHMKEQNINVGTGEVIVAKIDTEGHEASVLKGALPILGPDKTQVIIFEEFDKYPQAETFKILESVGYKIFRIERGFWGPQLKDPNEKMKGHQWEPTNYIAIGSDSPILPKLMKSGWSIFQDF